MASTKPTPIPAFYRIYFSTIDPLVLASAVFMDFVTPSFTVGAFIPTSVAPYNPYYDVLLQQLGGALLFMAILDVVLLRYTKDINIWKIVQVGVLSYDLILLGSIYYGLKQQHRLSLHALRFEDWGDIIITGQAAIVRSLFLLGVGLHQDTQGKKRA